MLKLTPKERVLFVRRLTPALLVLVGVFSLFITNFIRTPGVAEAATANTINFQARLQSASGAIVPDGNYNIEFKLYSGSTCNTATGAGCTTVWTEDYLNSNSQGLKTINGYLSANLGSITAFSGINWDQQLWMSMNIGGTSTGAPSWDGAMKPYLSLTAVPYAFSAGQLNTTNGTNRSSLNLQAPTGGDQNFVIQDQGAAGTYNLLTQNQSDNRYIQLQTGTPSTQQTGNINISGTVVASTIQVGGVDTAAAGTLSIGGTNATTINIATNNVSHVINIGTSTTADQFVSIGNYNGGSSTTVQGNSLYMAGNNVIVTAGNEFLVKDSTDKQLFIIENQANLTTLKTDLQANGNLGVLGTASVNGVASFGSGINITGYISNTYTTPSGVALQSAITIQNHDLAEFGSILGLGVTANSAASARGILVADDRTGTHQPTIGVLSASEDDILGLNWDGPTAGSQTAQLTTLASDIAIAPASTTAAVFSATSITLSQNTSVNANITISGNVAYAHGSDFATNGTSNDVNFGSGAIFRLTGTSAQTITGITGGTDGRQLTLMNASGQAAILSNNSVSSLAANRIITGTSSDYTIAAGSSVSLAYDSISSVWRLVGAVAGSVGGGSYVTLQATTPGTADTGNLAITGTALAGALQAASLDTAAAGALTLGGANASSITIGHAGISTTITGLGLTVNTAGTSTITAGGTLSLQASGSSRFTTNSGDMTIGTSSFTGKLILQSIGASGAIEIGNDTTPTISIGNNSNTTRTVDIAHGNTSTSATVNLGSQGTVNIGSTGSATTTNTTNINTTTSGTGTQIVNLGSSANAANALTFEAGNTGQIKIGDGATAHTIRIATGAAAQTVTIGSTNGSSSLALQAGTGGISLNAATTVSTTSAVAFRVQDASSNILLTADTSTGTITMGSATNGVIFTASGGLVASGTARHTKKVMLTAEYAGAVLDATSDTGGANCSTNSSGTLTTGYGTGLTGINNTTQNYYQWTSSQSSAQCYDVIVQVPIPADFSAWSSSTPLAINTYTSNTTNGTVALQAIAGNGTTESNCNYISTTPGSANTWTASGGSCTVVGSYNAGDMMTLRIRVTSSSSATVRLGNITLSYKSSF